jgi:protein-S-isoprenylcysteine O-methyltransferase Ste14
MGITVLVLEISFLVLAVGGRAWLQRRWTGSSGITIRQAAVTPAERAVKLLLLLTVVGLGVTTALALDDGAAPGQWHAPDAVRAAGLALAVLGIAGTLWAQVAMGTDWRIGMDHETPTNLVTDGPFRWVRNPIYTAMVVFVAGIALALPSVLTALLVLATAAEVQLQVRRVEEPFLLERHDRDFATWAARAGRFLPGIGRRALA